VLALALIASSARADPTDADRENARVLMDRGDALIEEQKFGEALDSYRQAHAIMRVPTTGIEIARTLTKLGRIAEAKRVAGEIAAMPVTDNEPGPFAEARTEARSLFEELIVRIPLLTILAPDAERVTVDGVEVPTSKLGQPIELEPGKHLVVATRARKTASRDVMLTERDRKNVTLSFDAPAPPEPAPAVRPVEPKAEARRAPSDVQKTIGWIGIGVGGGAILFGAAAGGMALSQRSKLDDSGCANQRCPTSKSDDVDRYNTLRTLSSVGLIGGAVIAGAGAVLVLTSNQGSRERTRIRRAPSHTRTRGAWATF
jgi:hypothetical protein